MTEKITRVATVLPGPRSAAMMKKWHQFEADKTGFQVPIVVDHGEGALLYDLDGNVFIDWTSGVLVTNVGHCHPRMVKLMQEAAAKIIGCYEYPTEYRIKAAEKVMATVPGHLDKCFFFCTGGEATDAMMRIMKKKTGHYEIISFSGGFHGRIYAPASAGGLSKIHKKLGPVMPGVIHTPFPYCYRCPFKMQPGRCGELCLEYLDEVIAADSTGSLAGFMGEPYLGTAGFVFAPDGWWPRFEKMLRERQLLFALDEVQSSFGRTGKMWFMEHEGITPDIVAAAKGIGSGMPVSAIIATNEILDCLDGGDLGSTNGGHPVGCAATIAVTDIIREENLCGRSESLGRIMYERLHGLIERAPHLGDVRGKGLMIGLEMVEEKPGKTPASGKLMREIVCRCAQKGLLTGIVGMYGNVIRVGPPLVLTEEQMHESLDIMEAVLLTL